MEYAGVPGLVRVTLADRLDAHRRDPAVLFPLIAVLFPLIGSLPRNKWTLYTITELVDDVHFVILSA